MPLIDALVDRVVLIPPADNPDGQGGVIRTTLGPVPAGSIQTVPARIEPTRSGRRLVAEQGDVGIGTHVLFVQPQLYDGTGAVITDIQRQLDVDWHVRDPSTGRDYIVVAPPRLGRDRRGTQVLLEADLQVVRGGI